MPMALAVSTSIGFFDTDDDSFDVRAIGNQLDAIREVGIRDSAHLAALMTEVEAAKRRAHALSIDLLEASEQAGTH